MERQTFYERFPRGLMTSTAKPDECLKCAVDGGCHHHRSQVMQEMIDALDEDIVTLVSLVPMPEEERGYVLRYRLIEHLLTRLREETQSRRRFVTGNLSNVRQVRSA